MLLAVRRYADFSILGVPNKKLTNLQKRSVLQVFDKRKAVKIPCFRENL